MKKQVLLSAIAGALLIGTVAPSCKKGDTGAPGKDGVAGATGKDGKDGKDGINTTAESAEVAVRSLMDRYKATKLAVTDIEDVAKGGLKDLVSNEDVQTQIRAINGWVSEDDKKEAVKSAAEKLAAVKALLSYTEKFATKPATVKALYDAYAAEVAKVKNAKAKEEVEVFGKRVVATTELKNNYRKELKSFDGIKEDLTVIDDQTAMTFETALETEQKKEAKSTNLVNTLARQQEKARKAELAKLTDNLGAHVDANATGNGQNVTVTGGVTADQKTAIANFFDAKADLLKQVGFALKNFGTELTLEKMGINADMKKELGL